MSFHKIFAEEDINQLDMGFNSALFINVPKWEKQIKKDLQEKEMISAESTPDQTRLMELNKSFVNNLLSKDLIKKLEEASPFKITNCEFDEFFNKKLTNGNKLCFDDVEKDFDDLECEDSETKASKISKESFFSADGFNIKKSNNSCLYQKNRDNVELHSNLNNSYKAAKSFDNINTYPENDLKFNLLNENKFDSKNKFAQIKNNLIKANHDIFNDKTNEITLINNQFNNLFNNEVCHSKINFSQNKKSSKINLSENNSEQKNIPIGFSSKLIEGNSKIESNMKFSNSEKKSINSVNTSINYLNYLNYNQPNYVNTVNKRNQMSNNCFFPINNNIANLNMINSTFPNTNQSNNINNINYYNYNNYQNFLALNLTNNLINTNLNVIQNNNNIKNIDKNFENYSFNNFQKCYNIKSNKFTENDIKKTNVPLISNNLEKSSQNFSNKNSNKENLNIQNNFKKEFRKEINTDDYISNNPELVDIRKDKMNKLNKGKNTNKNLDINKKKKKPFIEREGDWVCHRCKNLNFSFRLTCNRCNLTKDENEKLFKKNSSDINKLNISSDRNSYDKDISDD